jgi:hypothetical protein
VLLAVAVTVSACGADTLGPGGEPAVARLQLSVGNQVVVIDRNGAVEGGPITIRAGVDVLVVATFLQQSGLPDPNVTAAEFELTLTPLGGAAGLLFTPSTTNAFAGTLRSNFPETTGSIRLALHHAEEQKDYWGPFTTTVVVTN